MTEKEALEFFEGFIKTAPINPYTQSAKLAIKALEKQIPKRAILDTSFPSVFKWWRCPVCAQNNIETNERFCYRCGQALDWSDEK